jgi:GH15 family glucan-1,4-alpha-glucosidase
MILDALDVQFRRAASQIVAPVWEGLAGFVDAALEHWRKPDQGIWEVRGEPKHFTASKVMCWVAAARGADLAAERGDDKRAQRWRAGADKIKAEVLDKGVRLGASSGSTTRPTSSTPRCCSWPSIEAVSMLIEMEPAEGVTG